MDLPFDAELEFRKRACVTQTLVEKKNLEPIHCCPTYSPFKKQLAWEYYQHHSAALVAMIPTWDQYFMHCDVRQEMFLSYATTQRGIAGTFYTAHLQI